MPKHVDPQQYWEARSRLTEVELARLFLPAAGVSNWLVDTGFGDEVTDVAQLSQLSGRPAYEVVRLEQVAVEAARPGRPVTTRRSSRRSCTGARPPR
ncbi:hypothetical protein IWGMT90018_29650 [Mycobacterium kiyosense]|nr:hypothetical protein IWGMT90018_29650 [Mycobacterium kiyosense]